MRGTLTEPEVSVLVDRIIPAHAGNSTWHARRWRLTADHPRACGELSELNTDVIRSSGSSPRMRGTRHHGWQRRARHRIIPAHAGNSLPIPRNTGVTADHPRACGELAYSMAWRWHGIGSSPRMRGTLEPHVPVASLQRIIPAHAGNSVSPPRSPWGRSDHPRACGELGVVAPERSLGYGSSPRMRGTLLRTKQSEHIVRIIPAHAGNSRC